MLISDEYRLYYSFLSLEAEAMDLNVMRFFTDASEEAREEEYVGPRLLKTGHLNIIVRTPKSFMDVREYADSLLLGSAVMISFEAVDVEVKNRIFDYLNGVAYIAEAHVSVINDELLLYTPETVEVSKEQAVTRRSKLGSWIG